MDEESFLSLMFTIIVELLLSSCNAPKTKSESEEKEEEEKHGAQNTNALASFLPPPLPRGVLLLAALSIARRNMCVFSLSSLSVSVWFFQNRGGRQNQLSLGFNTKP